MALGPRSTRRAAATLVALACLGAVAAGDSRSRVASAVERIYFHGIDAATAEAEVGAEGVPALLELLADPACARRDNVVAFLTYLGDDRAVPALLRLLESPPADPSRPEEDRGLLLAPRALGQIAARGGLAALDALGRLADPAGGDGPLQRAARRGAYPPSMARDLLEASRRGLELARSGRTGGPRPGASALAAGADLPSDAPSDGPPAPRSIDAQSRGDALPLTFANHVDHPDPIGDARLDTALAAASSVAGVQDFTEDVACCITVERSGAGRAFGSAGDGLDVVDTEQEIQSVLNNGTARVKVVRAINYCAGSATNIIGCSWLPGGAMVVVRMSSATAEGVLWLHEFGHNAGLNHNDDSRYVMHARYNGTNVALTQSECNGYHSPSGSAGISPRDIGVCHDDDGDLRVSTTDNCPRTANPTQTDGDADGVGTACDNCPLDANASQADADADGAGDVCDGCTDVDDDGWGDPASALCELGESLDCNDAVDQVYPGAPELCDGLDNDCDGEADNARCAGFDVNADDRVDGHELAWVGRAFGSCSPTPQAQWWGAVDYSGDGCVDGVDLALLGAVWACSGTGPVCD